MEAENVTQLVRDIKKSPELLSRFNNNPLEFLENVEDKPMDNKWIFLFIVSVVGLVLVSTITIASILIFRDGNVKVPEFLVSLSSTALGAIVGLLAPSPKQ